MASIDGELAPPGTRISPRQNLALTERGLSVAAGAVVGLFAAQQRGTAAAALGVLGSLLVARGVTGAAPLKRAIGQTPDERAAARAAGWSRAALVSRSVTINAPRTLVWSRFRDLESWPDFSVNVERVELFGNDSARFTTRDPAGLAIFNAGITEERVNELLAFASVPGTPVPINSRFEFRDAPGGRGTEIHASIVYRPPGGSAARYAAKLTQREPGIQLRRDLKRLKSLIETGEIATNAPQGTAPKA